MGERLPESVQALYAELLDQHVVHAAEVAARGLPPPGSFVSKVVKSNRYWYLQRSEGGTRTQVYLGPESERLLRWMESVRESRRDLEPDRARRAELVAMLRTSGAASPDAATGRVIQVLAERGLFRSGAVLIGTHAFASYGNMLGIVLGGRSVRTADVDILHDTSIVLAIDPSAQRIELPEALREADPEFLAVPPLQVGDASTSFKVRGRDLRVDFLSPGDEGDGPVRRLPHLEIATRPLPGLEYLLEDVAQAVVLFADGVLVNVPDPARFALHKLWLARNRRADLQVKALKDRLQAEALIEALSADRPTDLEVARGALPLGYRDVVRKEFDPRP